MTELKTATAKLTRSEEKRLAIIDAAREVFLAKGFEQTSMDAISHVANVSKRTIYSHFKSKEKLFASIMTDMCQRKHDHILEPAIDKRYLEDKNCKLEEIIKSEYKPDLDFLVKHRIFDDTKPIHEVLYTLGERFVTDVYLPTGTSLMRILVGQAETFPEIGKEFFDHGPLMMLEALSTYFTHTNKQSITDLPNPNTAAEMLLCGLLGVRHLQLLTYAQPAPSEDEIKIHVKKVVDLFLKGAEKKPEAED